MAGFATLAGGDTVSFNVDQGQNAAVQSAITALNAGYTSDHVYTSIQSPTDASSENVFSLDGGTTVPFVGGATNAVILDSVNAFTATNISTADYLNVLVIGNEGADSISILAASSVIAGSGQDTVFIDSWHHGGGANYINVGNGSDSLTMVGNGTLIAGDGNNNVTVQNSTYNGTDVVTLGNGNNNVSITTGYATVTAGNGDNTININAGADPVNNSVINVGSGSDSIYLGQGEPFYQSYYWVQSQGNATVYGASNGGDSVSVTGGNVSVVAGATGNDTFTAGLGNATLNGGADSGNETFYGGAGLTSMIGGSGENFFYGGSGSDTMVATGTGANQNTFNFDGTQGGNHVIQGYDNGDSSTLQLDFSNYAGLTADQVVADSSMVGSDLQISIPASGGAHATTITIKNVTSISNSNVVIH